MYCTNDNFKGINIAGLKLCLAVRIERLIDIFFQKVIIAHNHNIRLISTNALACKKCMISELTDYSQNGNIVMKWFLFFCNFNHFLFILSSIFFFCWYHIDIAPRHTHRILLDLKEKKIDLKKIACRSNGVLQSLSTYYNHNSYSKA